MAVTEVDGVLWSFPQVLLCGQRCGAAGPRRHVEAGQSLSLTQWKPVEASASQEQLLLPRRAAAPRGRRSSLPGLSPTSSRARAPRGIQLPLQLLSWAAVAMESSSRLRRSPSPAAAQASRRASWEPVRPALCRSSRAEEQAQGSWQQAWADRGRRRWSRFERRWRT